MSEKSSQNENTFLQKNLIGLLYYDPINQCVYFIRPSTLLLYIFLFCIFLLYCADQQVEVQIRILLKEATIVSNTSQKYRELSVQVEHSE